MAAILEAAKTVRPPDPSVFYHALLCPASAVSTLSIVFNFASAVYILGTVVSSWQPLAALRNLGCVLRTDMVLLDFPATDQLGTMTLS